MFENTTFNWLSTYKITAVFRFKFWPITSLKLYSNSKKIVITFFNFFSVVFLTALVVNYKRSFSLQIYASKAMEPAAIKKTGGILNRFTPA